MHAVLAQVCRWRMIPICTCWWTASGSTRSSGVTKCGCFAYLRDLEQDALFAPAATILVLNEALVARNRPEKTAFQSTILEHPTFLKALDRGAKVVWMPRLAVAHEVDTRRLTFTAAEDSQVKPGQPPIGPWNRQLIHNWLP